MFRGLFVVGLSVIVAHLLVGIRHASGGPALSGDLTGDGLVDAADAGEMFTTWGAAGRGSASDLNGDEIVDAADAGILFEQWTGDVATISGPESGDFNGDGAIDAADAGILFENWTGDTSTGMVPEPASICLTVPALLIFFRYYLRVRS